MQYIQLNYNYNYQAINNFLNSSFFIFRVKIDDAGSLVIQYVRKEDHGRYQCSAKNLAATRDSRPIRLKVHGELDNLFLHSCVHYTLRVIV